MGLDVNYIESAQNRWKDNVDWFTRLYHETNEEYFQVLVGVLRSHIKSFIRVQRLYEQMPSVIERHMLQVDCSIREEANKIMDVHYTKYPRPPQLNLSAWRTCFGGVCVTPDACMCCV